MVPEEREKKKRGRNEGLSSIDSSESIFEENKICIDFVASRERDKIKDTNTRKI